MIRNFRLIMLFTVLLAFIGACAFGTAVSSNDVPRMTKEDLLSFLDNPEVVVIDVVGTG